MSSLKLAIIGGTGLADSLLRGVTPVARHVLETPFGEPSDAIVETVLHDLPVFMLNRHGLGHLLNPSHVPYRANIFALKQLGVTHIIASGAVGSLREEFKPRELVIPDQIIDKTTKRPATFYEHEAVHVEFSEPFCPLLRRILVDASGTTAHARGCYIAMEGPAFSTRAESLMHRLWGGDLIGMTAMPEAKLAREAEIAYALVALVTDYDCWRATGETKAGAPASILLDEIIGNLNAAATNAVALIRKSIDLIAGRREDLMKSPALNALSLAIWSEKSKIPPDEVQRLAPLWIKYLG